MGSANHARVRVCACVKVVEDGERMAWRVLVQVFYEIYSIIYMSILGWKEEDGVRLVVVLD